MNILAIKILIMPIVILVINFSGKRWGERTSGILIGLPLTSAPISLIITNQHGLYFGTQSAIGNLLGQIALCCFCLCYRFSARQCRWFTCVITSSTAFILTIFILNKFHWTLYSAFFCMLLFSQFSAFFLRAHDAEYHETSNSSRNLLLRIFLASTFVITLTSLASILGPTLSGLLAPFPILGIIFTALAHKNGGKTSVNQLLHGMTNSSIAYGVFFLVLANLLGKLDIERCYTIAILSSVFVILAQPHIQKTIKKLGKVRQQQA